MPGYDPGSSAFGDGAAPYSSSSTPPPYSSCAAVDRPQVKNAGFDDSDDSDNDQEPEATVNNNKAAVAMEAHKKKGRLHHVGGVEQDEDNTRHRSVKSYATDGFDVALYLASGVLLIFMMETFVQMGSRMRY